MGLLMTIGAEGDEVLVCVVSPTAPMLDVMDVKNPAPFAYPTTTPIPLPCDGFRIRDS